MTELSQGRRKDNASNIFVGPAGWSYEDWAGIVYPSERGARFDQLAYLIDYFDCIEINSTFYRPPEPGFARRWASKVGGKSRFKFTAKLWSRFTHEREPRWTQNEVETFKNGILPLAEKGRLGCLLLQFSWSFVNIPENREWLAEVAGAFSCFPLVAEFRHISWMRTESLDWLKQLGVGICNIDQPVSRTSVRPTALATSQVGYVRLHGRNYETWFKRDAGRDERYDYLYSKDELYEWVGKIRTVAEKVAETYVIMNNHFQGKAVANGLQLLSMLSGHPVRVPHSLLSRYPGIGEVALPEGAG